MDRQKIANLVLACSMTVILVSACGTPPSRYSTLTPITVQLNWTHNASFAGFYTADQLGYYAEEGLAVTLVEGGTGSDYLGPVANGAAQFGDAGADELLLARAKGIPLRAVATIYRRSPITFAALADSGITRPQDFAGKTIRLPSQGAASFHAMMTRLGIRPDQYQEVNLPSDIAVFASGKAQVWSVFINNFAVTLQEAGYKLNFIYPDDYGVHFYGDSIFSSDEYLSRNPDLTLRFLRATLKGWTYAVENPAAAGPLVSKYALQANPALETKKLTASLPLINTGEDQIGWMKPEIWAGMAATLAEQQVLNVPLDVSLTYTQEFLKQIYGYLK